MVVDFERLIETARILFFREWNAQPTRIWVSPGRVNIIGEHTDYQNGLSLPIAAPRATIIMSRARTDGFVDIRSAQGGRIAGHVELLRNGIMAPLSGFEGFVRGALALTPYFNAGADVLIQSDIPLGAGMSSSASLSLGLLATLRSLVTDDMMKMRDMVQLAQRLENVYLGVPCGILDQSAIVAAERGKAVMLDAKTGAWQLTPFPFAEDGYQLWVIDTKTPRSLSESVYQIRVDETNRAASALKRNSLREASLVEVESLADPLLRHRARHVASENMRVTEVIRAAAGRDWQRVSELMTASHMSLRDDFSVSTVVLDHTVEAVCAIAGMGARLMGAGMGGSVLAFGPKYRDEQLRRQLMMMYSKNQWASPNIVDVPEAGPGLHRYV